MLVALIFPVPRHRSGSNGYNCLVKAVDARVRCEISGGYSGHDEGVDRRTAICRPIRDCGHSLVNEAGASSRLRAHRSIARFGRPLLNGAGLRWRFHGMMHHCARLPHMHTLTDPPLLNDVAEIGRIEAVPRILETVAHITGSRFTAIARVTETTWTACATLDTLGFGLVPGGQLVLETTICDEIRQSSTSVVFARASTHPLYSKHHTPRIYGLESLSLIHI